MLIIIAKFNSLLNEKRIFKILFVAKLYIKQFTELQKQEIVKYRK